jgi:hypothetical protein
MAIAKRTMRIEASFDSTESVQDALSPRATETFGDVIIEGGITFGDVIIGDGITLTPLFLSIRASRAVRRAEALEFLLTVSSSIEAKTLADVIYKWFKKTKANRLKIERTQVLITRPDEVIRVIREAIDKDDSS